MTADYRKSFTLSLDLYDRIIRMEAMGYLGTQRLRDADADFSRALGESGYLGKGRGGKLDPFDRILVIHNWIATGEGLPKI